MKTKLNFVFLAYKNYLLCMVFIVSGGMEMFAFNFFQEQQIVQTFSEFKGTVIDSKSKAPLFFAILIVDRTNISTINNYNVKFLLKDPKTMVDNTVSMSFLGYQVETIPLSNLNGD